MNVKVLSLALLAIYFGNFAMAEINLATLYKNAAAILDTRILRAMVAGSTSSRMNRKKFTKEYVDCRVYS